MTEILEYVPLIKVLPNEMANRNHIVKFGTLSKFPLKKEIYPTIILKKDPTQTQWVYIFYLLRLGVPLVFSSCTSKLILNMKQTNFLSRLGKELYGLRT